MKTSVWFSKLGTEMIVLPYFMEKVLNFDSKRPFLTHLWQHYIFLSGPSYLTTRHSVVDLVYLSARLGCDKLPDSPCQSYESRPCKASCKRWPITIIIILHIRQNNRKWFKSCHQPDFELRICWPWGQNYISFNDIRASFRDLGTSNWQKIFFIDDWTWQEALALVKTGCKCEILGLYLS